MDIFMLVIKKDKKGNVLAVEKLNLREDVYYIGIENRILVYHTKEGSYYQINTFEEMSNVLEQFGFAVVDRGSLVNLGKVAKLDTEFSRVFFEEEVTKDSIFATVSAANFKKIRAYLESKKKPEQPEEEKGNES